MVDQTRRQVQFPGSSTTTVHLFGGPSVSVDGERVPVPHGSRRLLAFVALRRGRVERPYAAGMLWPFGDDLRASSNLRSSLWRLRRVGIDALEADKWCLWLADGVQVDVFQTVEWAGRLIHGTGCAEDLTLAHLPPDALNLLPGWCDDWAIVERERIRQRVLHALEALSRTLSAAGRHAEAVEVASRAVADEPLRESAQRVLIEALLHQGNGVEARRIYVEYAALVRSELGVNPSRQLAALVARTLVGEESLPGTIPGAAVDRGSRAAAAARG